MPRCPKCCRGGGWELRCPKQLTAAELLTALVNRCTLTRYHCHWFCPHCTHTWLILGERRLFVLCTRSR